MEGAFDAMGSGQVDVNWAREHHSEWLSEEEQKAAQGPARRRSRGIAEKISFG